MIKPEDLTKEQFLEQILEICDKNPDNVNPQDTNEQCVYEDPDGNHCLIGEWLSIHYSEILEQIPKESNGCRFRMGEEEIWGTPARLILKRNNFPEEVYFVAAAIQGYANGGYWAEESNGAPRKWSTVKAKIENGEFS